MDESLYSVEYEESIEIVKKYIYFFLSYVLDDIEDDLAAVEFDDDGNRVFV